VVKDAALEEDEEVSEKPKKDKKKKDKKHKKDKVRESAGSAELERDPESEVIQSVEQELKDEEVGVND
jgi:hypothetical protein